MSNIKVYVLCFFRYYSNVERLPKYLPMVGSEAISSYYDAPIMYMHAYNYCRHNFVKIFDGVGFSVFI